MKVLLINKFLYPKGGSETYIFKLGEHLKSCGHAVEYFGMDHEKRCVGNSVNAYTTAMDFHDGPKIEKLLYPLKTIYSKKARIQIRKVLEEFCPDVCHLNNFNYQLTPSIILEIVKWRKQTGKVCRIIFTAHDYQLICPNHQFKNPISNEVCEKCIGGKYLNCAKGKCIHGSIAKSIVGMLEAMFWNWIGVYRYIDKIICCSQFMKQKMDTNYIFKNKTIAIHNFVDYIEKNDCEKKEYVLYFGRFSQEKGIRTLIKVCRELYDIPFVFAGMGPLEKEIVNVSNIKNVGFQKGELLKKLIQEAQFSIYPAEWYENCPFSVMESLVYGTPILGAEIGGIPEILKDRETGELFESGNDEDLKRKIQKLWNDRELLKKYSQNCENIKFDSIEKYCEKLLKIYEVDEGDYE